MSGYIEIYSVITGNVIATDEKEIEIDYYRTELRLFNIKYLNKEGEIYTAENVDGEEVQGTLDELFDMFCWEEAFEYDCIDVLEESYTAGDTDLPENFDESNWDADFVKWHDEYFFKTLAAAKTEFNKEAKNNKSVNKSDNYEIDNDLPAYENLLGVELFKKDLSGLKAYCRERPNMGEFFKKLTNFIRNGYSVSEVLSSSDNDINDPEIREILATGFWDISNFLKSMLDIKENDEVRKDYDACLEAIQILKDY